MDPDRRDRRVPVQRSRPQPGCSPAGGVEPDQSEQLVVQNLSGRSTTVDVIVLGGPKPLVDPTLRNLKVPANGRATIRLDRFQRPTLPVEVRAASPVVVERGLYRTGRLGISISPGVPLPEGRAITSSLTRLSMPAAAADARRLSR